MKKIKQQKLDTRETKRTEQRLERAFRRIFPDLDHALPDIARLLSSFDPLTPRTTFAEGKKLLSSYAAPGSMNARLLIYLIKLGIKTGGLKTFMTAQLNYAIKIAKVEAEKDSRYSLLLKLMHSIDQIAPFGSYVVIHRHADPNKTFLSQVDPLSELEAAQSTTGERRFNHTKEAFRRTVEHLYDPYLRTLMFLSYLRLQKGDAELQQIHTMDLGNVMGHVEAQLSDYSGLFDARVVWFRNAITHEILDYELATDVITLKNRKRSGTIATTELLKLTESIYQLSAKTITLVSQLYLFREFYRDSGFFDGCIEYIPRMAVESDLQKLAELEKEFAEYCESIVAQATK